MVSVEQDLDRASGKSLEEDVRRRHKNHISSQRDDTVLERLGKRPQLKV